VRIWADSGQSRVRQVIEEAFRRSSLVLVVEHSAIALAAVFGGLILLLLLGTQIFDGRWLLVVALAGAAIMFVRVRGRILSRYRVAQLLDRRLDLHDSLSTAWFLLESPGAGGFAQAQIERAEQTAENVKPAAVFPFVWRRAWALAGALFAVAFGLFALRYLVTSSLSLKQALIPLSFPLPAEVLERIGNLAGGNSLDHKNELKASLPNAERRASDGSEPSDRASNRAESAGKRGEGNSDRHAPKTQDLHQGGTQQGQSADRANSSDQTQSPAIDKPRPDQAANGRPSSDNQSAGKESSEEHAPQNSSSLLDRMKDALSGLMAKMRQDEGKTKTSERSPQQQSGEQAAENRSRNGQTQQNSRSPQQSDGQDRQQNSLGQQGAQASEKPAAAQSHASDASANRKGADSQSGIGRQDGEKSLREADQLRAMGKLDEIIGKRSASLTGDMTVETRSGHQTLQTQYSGRVGSHADLGGEIDRDEVPVALQQYVREYMEQVRKQANSQP
jgi:hypothetical protein